MHINARVFNDKKGKGDKKRISEQYYQVTIDV